jgi:NAD(P)-dependent dehydrogenase (short-subunit alcohol dehydrogenase family)
VKIMLAQGTGGCLLFNVSKQAINPGPNFGPYGLPKAATLALVRQYAPDYRAEGIRANAVNADCIRSELLDDAFIAERARARGVSEKAYMSGNLLIARSRRRTWRKPSPRSARAQNDGRRDDRRRRQNRGGAAVESATSRRYGCEVPGAY